MRKCVRICDCVDCNEAVCIFGWEEDTIAMDEARKLAIDILEYVNSFGYDTDTFAQTIAQGHRTLQQSTMRLFIAAIREMAKAGSDERNAQTVELAKKIVEIADGYSLPLI